MARTDQKSDTPLTQPDSRPVRYQLFDKHGDRVAGPSLSASFLVDLARSLWPDQEQDEEHSGMGWDIQVVESLPPAPHLLELRGLFKGIER